VRVIHQHGYRGLLRIGGQQAEGRRTDGEAARRAGGRPERERALQRRGLRVRDLLDPGQRRPHELEQAGERDLSLRLHPAGPEHAHADRLLLGVGEQRRLADTGLPGKGQHTAAARARIVKQTGECLLLLVAAEQHVSDPTDPPGTKLCPPRCGLGACPEAREPSRPLRSGQELSSTKGAQMTTTKEKGIDDE